MSVNFQILLLIKSVNRLRENRMTPTYNSDRNREGWSTCESWGLSQSQSLIQEWRGLCAQEQRTGNTAGQVRKKWGFPLANVPTISYITVHLKWLTPVLATLHIPKCCGLFVCFFSFDSRVEISCTSRHQSLLGRGVTISSFFQLLRTCYFFVTKASNVASI